jgi:hypothetical protein
VQTVASPAVGVELERAGAGGAEEIEHPHVAARREGRGGMGTGERKLRCGHRMVGRG